MSFPGQPILDSFPEKSFVLLSFKTGAGLGPTNYDTKQDMPKKNSNVWFIRLILGDNEEFVLWHLLVKYIIFV